VPGVAFDVTLGRLDGWTVVRAAGEIDMATADRFGRAVRGELGHGPVMVDLGGLTFMDSSGVRAIHGIVAAARQAGWTLRFSPRMRDNVRQVLMLTGMLEALPFADEPPGGAA